MSAPDSSERVLIVAPGGRDAAIAASILKEAGLTGAPCAGLDELVDEMDRGAGLAILTEEVLRTGDPGRLAAWISAQPPWSDFPIVLLTRHGGGPERNPLALRAMEMLGNVTFVERPFHPTTLVAMVRMALRARRRQYEARTRLEDLRLARETAEAARREAERAAQSKSRFLAAASHDLRQPLQSLLLFAEVLSSAGLGDRERRVMTNIDRSLDALKVLLDAILDVSKLDAGIVTVNRCDVPVRDALNQIKLEYADRAAARRLDFRVVDCSAIVHTDPALFVRMLRNLVENALRYTRAGGILVGCRRRGDRLLVQVVDTGIGIADDKLQEIFEEFTQVGNSERDRDQGLGLGLAIVRRLSELLDHSVAVRSRPDHGSVFSLAAPLTRKTGTEAALLEASDTAAAPDRGPVVLAIDDDPVVLMGIVAMMNAWGKRVLSATSGAEALQVVRASGGKPDLILADYRLRSGETGLDAIDGVRRHLGWDVPAILLTGDTAPLILREAHDRGVRLLHKPVLPPELKRALESGWMNAAE